MDTTFLYPLFQIALFGLVLTCITAIILIITAPSAYNPYRAELIEGVTFKPPAERETEEDDPQYADIVNNGGKLSVDTSVQVVVLGDIGRSPRMQYHALSIAKCGGRVDVVGYAESEVNPEVAAHPLISIVPLAPAPKLLRTSNKLLFLLFGPLKVLWQSIVLYRALGYRTKPAKFMLIQNPPSIPTLLIASTISLWRNTRLIIDWHNFSFSMLALKLGPSHPFVLLSRLYEFSFARFATAHCVVSDAMARHLRQNHGIHAQTLHDRPSEQFKPLTETQRSAFLARLPETAQHFDEVKSGAWRLLVSSTSWTADEDFSLLLDALVEYSAHVTAQTHAHLPKIIAIITGKGPQKQHYLSRISRLNQDNKLSNVIILTAWLSTHDYASLLGAADLGVSLHTSSSGLDLPMKVVDMFGAGLPVVGWSRYEAWPELVKEGVNGRGFGSAEELAGLLVELLRDGGAALRRLKAGAVEEGKRGWEDEWLPVAAKLFGLKT